MWLWLFKDDKEDAVADYHYAEFYGENDYKTKLKGKDDVGKKKRRKISESVINFIYL